MRLRVHHLLCSALYAGKGYSEGFCENMQEVVGWLWEKPLAKSAKEVELVITPDNICQECPNLTAEGCSLEDNYVVSKDVALAQELGLETNRIYPVLEVLHIVAEHLTAEIFETSCHNCEWYRQGLCHYEKLKEKYQTF